MPKERRDRSVSFDRYKSSPYSCSSSHAPKGLLETGQESVKEWEEARCPVCMEHPHNAVLLLCSSHEKGCRPYMCDTSYRHSNCFDQFQKSFSDNPPPLSREEEDAPNAASELGLLASSETAIASLEGETLSCENSAKRKLFCPLCRGQVRRWVVVEPARRFMNAKSRSCARETCGFNGTYADLRKHARLEHPLVRPSEADPERQRNWRRMERQNDLGDLLSTLQSSFGDDMGEEGLLPIDERGWLNVYFLIRVFRPGSSSSWSGASRARAQVSTRRRRSTRLWGESYDRDSGSPSRDEGGESSDGGLGRRRRRTRRRTSPADHP